MNVIKVRSIIIIAIRKIKDRQFKVYLFQTEHAGQAKQYMEAFDESTDAIIIAGGNGLVGEVS